MMKSQEKIDRKYLPALSRIFSPLVMDSLSQMGFSPYLREVCSNSGYFENCKPSITLGDFFDEVYSLLFKSYRSEYIYKNVIANKILLGKHSLKTSQMLTEFRVGNNKADVVILNGTSTVYEIKSEYDSFDRLQNQIETYLEIFDFINVITSPSQLRKLSLILTHKVGILVLTDRNTVSIIREPQSNKENFNPSILFDSLRKDEYIRIIKDYYGLVPDVPNTMIFKECKKLFCNISPIDGHDLAIKVLKDRNNSKILEDFLSKAPVSMTAYAMTIGNQEKKMHILMDLFDRNFSSLLLSNAN